MKLLSSQSSFQGGRNYNEDSIVFRQKGKNAIAVVADGLGGCGGGDIASHIVVDVLERSFFEKPIISKKQIQKMFEDANKAICAKQEKGIRMKSTAVSWFYNGEKFAVAHIGDSRLYHFRQNEIIFMTKDHSVPNMLFQTGEITEKEIRFHEDRNKLLRALGSNGEIRVQIEIWDGNIEAGDVFLLCSDGFWEYVWENEMIEDLSKSNNPQQWIGFMNERIRQKNMKDNDNFSAIAIFCVSDSQKKPDHDFTEDFYERKTQRIPEQSRNKYCQVNYSTKKISTMKKRIIIIGGIGIVVLMLAWIFYQNKDVLYEQFREKSQKTVMETIQTMEEVPVLENLDLEK